MSLGFLCIAMGVVVGEAAAQSAREARTVQGIEAAHDLSGAAESVTGAVGDVPEAAGNVPEAAGNMPEAAAPLPKITLKQALEEVGRLTGCAIIVNYDNIDPSMPVTFPPDTSPNTGPNTGAARSVNPASDPNTGPNTDPNTGPNTGPNKDPGPTPSAVTANLSPEELVSRLLEGTGFVGEAMGRFILIVPEPPKIDDGTGARSAMWHSGDDGIDRWTETRMLTFRIDNTAPEADFMENALALDELDRSLTDTAVLVRIDHISVTAASPPGGNTDDNERLAMLRAQATKNYLTRRYPHIAPDKIQTFSVGEEWSGLRRLVDEDEQTPRREEVLALLDNLPDEVKRDSLGALAGGRVWRHIDSRLLPLLRGATAVTLHLENTLAERRIDTIGVIGSAAAAMAGSGVQRVEILAARPAPPYLAPRLPVERQPLFAVRTNLLFDAASALNLGVEVPLGSRWSVMAEAMFPWWMTVGGNLEARYWIGRKAFRRPLTGWFAGAYIGGGWYDFEWIASGYDGSYFHAGLSGGYAHPVSRNGRMRMEYSLGLGYLRAGGHNFFGPTRAGVSLVFMLDRREPAR